MLNNVVIYDAWGVYLNTNTVFYEVCEALLFKMCVFYEAYSSAIPLAFRCELWDSSCFSMFSVLHAVVPCPIEKCRILRAFLYVKTALHRVCMYKPYANPLYNLGKPVFCVLFMQTAVRRQYMEQVCKVVPARNHVFYDVYVHLYAHIRACIRIAYS